MVTAEPGITWWGLDRVLRERGRPLKSYPSSALSATLGGWIMGSGLGIGSLRHGEVFGAPRRRATVALPDGTIVRYSKEQGPGMVLRSEGMLGVLTGLP